MVTLTYVRISVEAVLSIITYKKPCQNALKRARQASPHPESQNFRA